jgi:hypothetical protein
LNMRRLITAYPTFLALLLVVLLFPGKPWAEAAPAAVGQVIVAVGPFTATQPGGKPRPLSRRSPVFSGDVLVTGDKAQGQVRFSDGSLVSLHPRSEFRVDDFRFDGSADGDENAAFTLIKGGMRTITGVIGKQDRSRYKMSTDVATIGVRGTHYVLQQCTGGDCGSGADGLYGGVVDGSIVVSNGGGERVVDNDQFFHVSGSNSAAQLLLTPPAALFPAGEDEGQGAGGEDDENSQQGAQGGDDGNGGGDGGTPTDDETSDAEDDGGGGNGTGSDGPGGADGETETQTGDGDRSAAPGFGGSPAALGTDPNLTPNNSLVSDGQMGGAGDPAVDDTVGDPGGDDTMGDPGEDDAVVEPGGGDTPTYVSAPSGAPFGVAFVITRAPDDYDVTSGVFIQGEGTSAGLTDIKLDTIDGVPNAVVLGELWQEGSGCSPCTIAATEASLTDTGTYGGIHWGRWSEGFAVTESGVAYDLPGSLHYIYSPNETPYSTVQSMTGMFSYSLAGGTSPTDETGAAGQLGFAMVDVDFSSQIIIHAFLDGTVGNKEFWAGSEGEVPLSQLYGSGGIELTGGCSGCGDTSELRGQLDMRFVGPQAEYIMGSYGLKNIETTSPVGISGTIALEKGSFEEPQ